MAKANKAQDQEKAAALPAVPPETPKSRRLECKLPEGKSRDRACTDLTVEGLVSNASTVIRFSGSELGELSLTDMVASLRDSDSSVNGGDMRGVEQMLSAQAISLNAIFGELARRSALNMGTYLDPAERYMRLALKAQGQCRATLETLAAIKNPPVVFARQANISNGPQQVNNGVPASDRSNTRAPSQACGEIENQPSKLLEGMSSGSTTLDARAAGAAARGHQELEAVGAVHRSADNKWKGRGV